MTRRALLSSLSAIILGIVMAFAAPDTVSAQQQSPLCCTYTVDIQIPASCFRVLLWTRWSNGVFGPQIFAANGVYTFNTPTPPVCPPAATFIGASLAGAGGPFASYNNPVQFNVNGCCLVARITYVNGCTYIYIRPC